MQCVEFVLAVVHVVLRSWTASVASTRQSIVVSWWESVVVSGWGSVTGIASATPVAVSSAVWPVPQEAIIPCSNVWSCPRSTSLVPGVPVVLGGLSSWASTYTGWWNVLSCHSCNNLFHMWDSCPWYDCNHISCISAELLRMSYCIDDVDAVIAVIVVGLAQPFFCILEMFAPCFKCSAMGKDFIISECWLVL